MRIFIVSLLLSLSLPLFAQSELKFLTFNVYAKPDPFDFLHTEERMSRICEEIKISKWDVVFLQEVWTTYFRKKFKKCGFNYFMDIEESGDSSPESSLGSGLMILSRYPMKNMKRLILSRPSFNWKALIHGEVLVWKSVYLAQLVLQNKKTLWISNTHLVANYCDTDDFSFCDSYDSMRANQLKETSLFIKKNTDSNDVVFGGDLNSGPQSFRADQAWKSISHLFSGFHQADYDLEKTCTSCMSNYFKTKDGGKLDHIFASERLLAVDAKIVMDQKFNSKSNNEFMNFSDHYGWETTIKWKDFKP